MTSGVEIKKNWLGQYYVYYACPKCSELLRAPIIDIGKPDPCPNCRGILIVPGTAQRDELLEATRLRRLQEEQDAARRVQEKEEKERQRAATAEAQKQSVIAAQAAAAEQERQRAEQSRIEADERRARDSHTHHCQRCGAEFPVGSDSCSKCGTAVKNRTLARPYRRALIGILAAGICAACALLFSWIRNSDLRDKLESCESYGTINARVYYGGYVATDTVVFDLMDGGSETARRIDPVHLLLQFSSKLDLHDVRRVVLARNGHKRFYIESSYLEPLAESYANGGRLWSFNNLPQNIRTMTGGRQYEEWSGGWLGVIKQQADDLNDFIREWTGY